MKLLLGISLLVVSLSYADEKPGRAEQNSDLRQCQEEGSSLAISEKQIVPVDTIKGYLLVGRKAVFSVKTDGITQVQSEQTFTSFNKQLKAPVITCATANYGTSSYSMIAPTVLDLRENAAYNPVVWQFNTLKSKTDISANNNVSRILSQETSAAEFLKEFASKAKVYKVSNYQYAVIINETDGKTEKKIAVIYDAIRALN